MTLYQLSTAVGSLCAMLLAVALLVACLHPRAFHIKRH